MSQDISTYERKAARYMEAFANEAERDCHNNETDKVTVKLPDTLEFWVQQVWHIYISSLFTEYSDTVLFQLASKEYKTNLPDVLLDLLVIPPTSTASERLFSCAGYLSQNRSSRISSKNLENRCLLKTNPNQFS